MSTLTARQVKFAQAYALSTNGMQAALSAGYSRHTAASQGARLLKNVGVQAEIGRIRDKATSATVMNLTEACERLTKIARADDDVMAVKAIAALARLKGWDQPAKIALTTPDGAQPYQPMMTPDEFASTYREAFERVAARINGEAIT